MGAHFKFEPEWPPRLDKIFLYLGFVVFSVRLRQSRVLSSLQCSCPHTVQETLHMLVSLFPNVFLLYTSPPPHSPPHSHPQDRSGTSQLLHLYEVHQCSTLARSLPQGRTSKWPPNPWYPNTIVIALAVSSSPCEVALGWVPRRGLAGSLLVFTVILAH